MMEFSFKGLMAPVFTPFLEDRKINFEVIPKYAEYLHLNGIKGILVNGTTGEGVSLTLQERKDVLEAWIEACKPYEQTIMVQVGGTNMEDVKRLVKHAEKLQVAAILCLADLFFRPSSVDDLVHYLKIVSKEALNVPLLYYHLPSFTGINLNMKTFLERSREIPNFVGIKFTDSDLAMGTSCVSTELKHLRIFLGCDSLLLPALLQGFDSAIGTTVNIFPQKNIKILQCFKEGDFKKAIQEQANLNHCIEQITKHGSWVSSMKAAMRMISPIEVGPVRDPLVVAEIKKENLNLL